MQPAFPLGQVVATPAALAFLDAHPVDVAVLLARHQSGDCGDLDEDDILANLSAIVVGERVFSSYNVGSQKIWIITESDRSVTTVLLPQEY